ncbi:hypothetical protein [Pseudobacteriovorax antillogorgiicola]|uniref:Uncharacterized protein n=1 Tax=Pseudobacteriovorax antillogorgiicola TaxID=1513793 RepID=A0A1Y6CIT1_9BACT|nr:hypothetical protein [Pseudobacteriovorax antillogorgiicola]TCS46713.1 hypothetical protein EDD56_12389 [Pseudobacteriovorax antillogorgiicola]SMF67043.1 hypothetical protein SAMN06296036_12389 [Pseudobacteriovorax antillogorgiicola]
MKALNQKLQISVLTALYQLMAFLAMVSSCTTAEEKPPLKTLKKQDAIELPPSCEQTVSCTDSAKNLPYMCQLEYQAQPLAAWGDSRCLAAQSLHRKLCILKADMKDLDAVSCVPDPSAGECPITPGFCTLEFRPSKCVALQYNQSNLDWNLRPTAWGSNPCVARKNLKIAACFQGLVPSLLSDIQCENDSTNGACPPKYDCLGAKYENTTCSISKLADTTLDEAWSVKAKHRCEATFKLKLKACRFANLDNKINPSDMGDIECD